MPAIALDASAKLKRTAKLTDRALQANSNPATVKASLGGWARPWFWILIVVLVAADLATKSWASQYAGRGDVPVLGEWLSIYFTHNPGGVFGVAQDYTGVLTLIRALAVILILWLVKRQPSDNRVGIFTLGLLVAGALGNLYDNLSAWLPWPGNGEVRDFIKVDLGPKPWQGLPDWAWPFDPWPIFNLADSCICIGFVLLLTGLAAVQFQPALTEEGPASGDEKAPTGDSSSDSKPSAGDSAD
ncbi:MAG: signal peptidase II [Planctomycetota bacterium]|nr:MAG: signal peptidase II [Planctomycetota bacterium]